MTDETQEVSDILSLNDSKTIDAGKNVSDSVSLVDSKLLDVGLSKKDTIAVSDSKLLAVGITKKDVIALSESVTKAIEKTLSDSFSISSGGAGDYVIYQHYTARQSNAKAAMDLLVTKINTIATTDTIYYVDVLSGPNGAQYVGVLIYGR